MKTPDTTVRTKNSVLGTLLVAGATAIVTAIALKNGDKIVASLKALAQHAADGTFTFPPAATMNGSSRQPATPAS